MLSEEKFAEKSFFQPAFEGKCVETVSDRENSGKFFKILRIFEFLGFCPKKSKNVRHSSKTWQTQAIFERSRRNYAISALNSGIIFKNLLNSMQ